MTNPDDIVRVRARNGGRASVYEANGWAQFFKAGLLEGNGVIQNTVPDMNVLVGGSTAKPDVLIAENPSGYKIALDIVGQQPIAITTPATDSRITSIVAYTDDLSLTSSETNVTGSPATCGLIVVNGATSATPSAPDDTDIRTAITADGATGSQAAYCVIAEITVESTTTALTNSLINIKDASKQIISANNIDFTTLPGNYSETEIDTGYTWTGGQKIYKKTVIIGSFSGTGTLSKPHNITNFAFPIAVSGFALDSGAGEYKTLPYVRPDQVASGMSLSISSADIRIGRDASYNITNSWVTIWYTKTSQAML